MPTTGTPIRRANSLIDARSLASSLVGTRAHCAGRQRHTTHQVAHEPDGLVVFERLRSVEAKNHGPVPLDHLDQLRILKGSPRDEFSIELEEILYLSRRDDKLRKLLAQMLLDLRARPLLAESHLTDVCDHIEPIALPLRSQGQLLRRMQRLEPQGTASVEAVRDLGVHVQQSVETVNVTPEDLYLYRRGHPQHGHVRSAYGKKRGFASEKSLLMAMEKEYHEPPTQKQPHQSTRGCMERCRPCCTVLRGRDRDSALY